jgi:hypothetical protein
MVTSVDVESTEEEVTESTSDLNAKGLMS